MSEQSAAGARPGPGPVLAGPSPPRPVVAGAPVHPVASSSDDPELPSGLLPTGAAFLAVTALLVLALGGLREISTIAAPVFLALTLVLTLDPVRRRLVDRGVPLWLATLGMVLVLLATLGGVLFGIGASLSRLITELPKYSDQFQGLYDQGVAQLDEVGVEVSTLDQVVGGIQPANLIPFLQTLLGGVGSVGVMVLFIALALVFLTIDLGDGRRRLAGIAGRRPHLAEALRDFSDRIRMYWMVSTVFGVLQGLANVILLLYLDVPLPFVWGMLAFIAAYIPNVGFVVGLVPPAILGLLEHGVGTLVAVVVGYAVINFVLMTLILPKFAGDAVGLNVTTTFMSLVFWSIVIGPLGALLAIPLTLFAKAVLIDSHPRSRWIGNLLVSSDRLDPPPGTDLTGATSAAVAPRRHHWRP